MKYREVNSKVREQVAALEKLEGYPKRAEHIGAEFIRLGLVPQTYTPGAIGWTDKLVDIVDVGGGDVECDLPEEVIARHAGKEVVVDGKSVRIDVRSKPIPEAPQNAPPKGDAGGGVKR